MNPILNNIIEARGGQYCHVIEVETVWELGEAVESLYSEFIDLYSIDDIKDFFNTLQVYALNDENEEEIYNFNFNECIDNLN